MGNWFSALEDEDDYAEEDWNADTEESEAAPKGKRIVTPPVFIFGGLVREDNEDEGDELMGKGWTTV